MSIEHIKQTVKEYEGLQEKIKHIKILFDSSDFLIRDQKTSKCITSKGHPRLHSIINNYLTDYYEQLINREDEIKLKLDALSRLLK
jgi:hypothetical protein